ncbi:hypothetical protein [Streptosporangium sp. KLBMP 9127]|nr:hypothetical protein [Streptosporangium sp. KLBMP 9127]
MRPRRLTRRALIRGGAMGAAVAAMAGCAANEPEPVAPAPPDPQVELLRQVIAGKERTIALYERAAADEPALLPFLERHKVHLAELRRRLPPATTPATAPVTAQTASPAPSGGASPGKVSRTRLRDTERKAAAARPKQLQSVSPPLAQLLASIGACEAAHVQALSRPL